MKNLPLEYTWYDHPTADAKILIGTLTISVRESVTYDFLAKCPHTKLHQLERKIKLKIEDTLKSELRKLLDEEQK